MKNLTDRLVRVPLMPVVTIDDPTRALPLVHALQAAGISCIEIVLRTPAAISAIEAVADVADFEVGAGTIVNAGQVDQAADAGAAFFVSPGLGIDVVERARERGLPLIPGIGSASDAQAAIRHGFERVKLFPAELIGGLEFIQALAAPFPSLRFMPSGGVSAGNAASYLKHPSVFAVGGSWMVPAKAIAEGDFRTIERLSREAVDLVSRTHE